MSTFEYEDDPLLEAIRVVRDVAPWMTDDELDKGPMRELRLTIAAMNELRNREEDASPELLRAEMELIQDEFTFFPGMLEELAAEFREEGREEDAETCERAFRWMYERTRSRSRPPARAHPHELAATINHGYGYRRGGLWELPESRRATCEGAIQTREVAESRGHRNPRQDRARIAGGSHMARKHDPQPLTEYELRERIAALDDAAEGRQMTSDEKTGVEPAEHAARRSSRFVASASRRFPATPEHGERGSTGDRPRRRLPLGHPAAPRADPLGGAPDAGAAHPTRSPRRRRATTRAVHRGRRDRRREREELPLHRRRRHPHYRSAFGKLMPSRSAHLRWTPAEHEAMQGVNRELEYMRALGISRHRRLRGPARVRPEHRADVEGFAEPDPPARTCSRRR